MHMPLPASPSPSPCPPSSSSSSSASSFDVPDIFSAKSASTTSFTTSSSCSSPLSSTAKFIKTPPIQPKTLSPSWSKDVRWLVPPNGSHHMSRSNSLASSPVTYLHGIGLIEIESRPQRKPRRATRRPRARTLQPNRMSAVWEEDETEELQPSVNLNAALPRSRSSSASTSHSPRRSRTAPSIRSYNAVSTNLSSISLSSRTVALPSPLPVSSGTTESTTGYSSLTLPRAAYTPSKHPERVSSSIDLTRSGLAQTTMSTIAITRKSHHDASTATRLIRRLSSSSSSSAFERERLQDDCSSYLSFTGHTPSPTKVHSTQVLVKVWAVGLDGLDAILVREKISRSEGFGYVPGRSFVGRVVECGWNVSVVSKGDWVIGLTEIKQGGALAEFVAISHRRVHPCRNPFLPTSLPPPQLALLPLCAVPAHRAVRTLSHLPKGSRALVLQADVGTGLLAAQELVNLGFEVTAQVPGGLRGWGSDGERRARMVVGGLATNPRRNPNNAKVRGDVRCGDALEVVNALAAAKEEFDAVIDTVGGKDMWDACRSIIKTNGQFTTLVGDMLYFHTNSNPSSPSSLPKPAASIFKKTPTHTLPTAHTHFLSNLRSLRFSLLKKDKKNIGYVWISPYADIDPSGGDIRDALASVVTLAQNGVLIPCVNSRTQHSQSQRGGNGDASSNNGAGLDERRSQSPISVQSSTSTNRLSLTLDFGSNIGDTHAHLEGLIFPFEKTPDAFKGNMEFGTGTIGALAQGGTVVVQIVE